MQMKSIIALWNYTHGIIKPTKGDTMKPETTIELMDMINGMNHRERRCFEISEQFENQDIQTIEIYVAMDWNGNMFHEQTNVTFTFADVSGKWHKGNPKRTIKRRLLRGNKKLLETVLSAIK